MTLAQTVYLHEYQKPKFSINAVELNFDLGGAATTVVSRLSIQRKENSAQDVPLVLTGQGLQLCAILLEDRALTSLDYQVTATELTIFNVPAVFTLTITVQINPAENTVLSGLYKSNDIFCTQCEAEGFRRITYFLDRPDVLTRFTTTITADKARYPILLSNGNLSAQGELANNRHWVTWHDPFLKPSYLFALVAGNLELYEATFITMSQRHVALKVYVDKGNLDKAYFAMDCIKKSMAWDEKAYGREYDLAIFMVVAINDFNMGAMENKGLNIFNAKYILVNQKISTDLDYQNVLRVVGHEYFHNWSGNRVTCRDWFQLSLKEGLTIFREQEFFGDMTSNAVARIDAVRCLRGRQFIEDAGPLAHPVRPDSYIEINNFYTNTIYNKGAEVIRMLKILLGPAKFRTAMDLYFTRFDGQAVTIEDFVRCMETVSGNDLAQFRQWYSQAGTPELTINYEYCAAAKTFKLMVQQSCPPTPGQTEKTPFYLPLVVGLLGQQGQELPLVLTQGTGVVQAQSCVLILAEREQTFVFSQVTEIPVPVLLKDFSAPVKLNVAYRDDELLFILQYERDGFARWDAGFQLYTRWLLKLIQAFQAGEVLILPPSFINAFRQILTNVTLDQAFITELLMLPSEAYLGEQLQEIDVEAIAAVHKFAQTQIAQQLTQELLTVYNNLQATSDSSLTESAMAARRLKNLCLTYLMQSGDPAIKTLCAQQYTTATTMTDRLAAFGALVHQASPQRAALLIEFYETWCDETLVIDKWLSIQAMADVPNVLEQIQALTQQAVFEIKNPNKVYALIGAFCQNNVRHFHVNTGAGYAFLGDNVITLNHLNPQIAARIVEPLTRWRRYDASRQTLMQHQLQRILAEKNLSKDVYELVTKSLAPT